MVVEVQEVEFVDMVNCNENTDFSIIDWNSIDFIFITNCNHMLASPYVTEYTDFKGKIYATEPTVLFGR